MKIVFFGESPADEAAMAVFTEGILGQTPEVIDLGYEGHGVTGVLGTLGGIYQGVYYQSDAEGLVVTLDCDKSELHHSDHDKPGGRAVRCRLCQAREIIEQARRRLRARSGRVELKVAIGLAVPAIEAWYLVRKNHQAGEAIWLTGLGARKPPFTPNQLKIEVYGTDHPSLERETEYAVREARRLSGDIQAVETLFPAGFGSMANEIRSWKV